MNEPDTCRKYVVPKLVAAGWDDEPHSMVEFKQVIGRGTRVRDDYGKLWSNILDYTAQKVRTLCASPDKMRACWADAGQRAHIYQPAKRPPPFRFNRPRELKEETRPSRNCTGIP
jgi:hypothetical protein